MVHKKADMAHTVRENVRGGKGAMETDIVFGPEDMAPKATLFNRMTVKPGDTIGEHPHTDDAEIYYVLKGKVVATDNGVDVEMEEGDAMYTANGSRHALRNDSGEEAVILAIVIA